MALFVNPIPAQHFGPVGVGQTKYKTIEISGSNPDLGERELAVRTANKARCAPLESLGWDLDATGTRVSRMVPPGPFSYNLELRWKAPSPLQVAPIVGLTVEGCSPLRTFTATAFHVLTAPAAMSFVMDRSASMGSGHGEATRIKQAARAALVCVELMNDSDEGELVYFDSAASTPIARGPMTAARRDQFKAALMELTVSGGVSPNSNIVAGVKAATGTSKLVFTDCLRTTGEPLGSLPTDPERRTLAVPAANANAYSILGNGLVLDGRVEGGQHRLFKLASQALIQAQGGTVTLATEWKLEPLEQQFFEVRVTEYDRELKAVVLSEHSRQFTIEFHRRTGENGQRLEPLDHYSGVTLSSSTLDVRELTDAECPPSEMPLRSVGILIKRKAATAGVPSEPLPFTLVVAAQSDVKLDAELHASSTAVGADLHVSGWADEAGLPVERDVNIEARLAADNGWDDSIDLRRVAKGRFAARLQAPRPGLYTLAIVATGRTRAGARFRRELERMVFLQEPGRSSGE